MTTESSSDSNRFLNSHTISRLVAVTFALSILLTAGTGLALAEDSKEIDANDSLFCNKEGTGDDSSNQWLHTTGSNVEHAKTNLGDVVDSFITFMFGAGVLGAFVAWQGSAIGNMLSLDRDQKRRLKKYRGSATKSFAILVLIGPLFSVITSVLSIQSVGCVGLSIL